MTHQAAEKNIVVEEERLDLKEPSKYKVIFLNDDYTPMDWVVWALETYFGYSMNVALDLMIKVHNDGQAAVGVYPKDIAESKSAFVNAAAQRDGYPFLSEIEED